MMAYSRIRNSQTAAAEKSALVRAVARRDLLDQFDDRAPHLGIGDACERAGQRKAFRCGEEVGHVGWRSALGKSAAVHRAARTAIEQERNRDLQDFRDLLKAAGADPVGAFFVFLYLLESEPERFAKFLLAQPSMIRRIRTRLPTYLSTGLGALVDICIAPG